MLVGKQDWRGQKRVMGGIYYQNALYECIKLSRKKNEIYTNKTNMLPENKKQ